MRRGWKARGARCVVAKMKQRVMALAADPTSIATSARATGVLVSQAIGVVLIDNHCAEALLCGELEEPVTFAQGVDSTAHSATEGDDVARLVGFRLRCHTADNED